MSQATTHRREILAGVLGNVVEWFDFAIYGFFAPVIGKQFFPSADPTNQVISAFAVFASGFLARPLGAAFFGHLGDRRGRRVVLRTSILLMGLSTLLLGCLPDFDAIGIAAPILLTVLRIAQGFSVAGEYSGSIIYLVERAPSGRRGFIGGWVNVSGVLGFLLGSGTSALISQVLTDDQLVQWGWRVPFLLGVSIAFLAFQFRQSISEQLAPAPSSPRAPLLEALRLDWRAMLQVAGLALIASVGFQMMFVYVTTYLSEHIGVPMPKALEIDTIAMAVLLVLTPVAAWLSDRIGRKPVLLMASGGCVVFAWPLFFLISQDNSTLILMGQLGFAFLVSFALGANSATFVEITHVRYRCTVISVAFNVTAAIFGGTAPLIASWLIKSTGKDTTPTIYLMAVAAITTAVVLTLRETYHDEIALPEL